jgi:hypothetical protein
VGLFNELLASNGVRITASGSASHLSGTSDPDYNDNRLNAYRRLTGKQNERDLQPLEQQRMTEIALFLYDANPLAKRIIDLVNSFVTGDGFTFNAKHPTVLSVLKRLWEDPVNDWPMKQLDRFKMLSLCGEVLWPVAVRRTDGRVHMGYADPVNVDERPLALSYKKLTYCPEPYGAFYFALNKPPNAIRGRSDLITVFDWLELYDQYAFGLSDGRQVNGHGLQTSNAWAWRHGPQVPGIRYVRLRAASPTYGAVAITIAKESDSEDAYYGHLVLRLMGCLVWFYSSWVVCTG